jgi:hypothetical protein
MVRGGALVWIADGSTHAGPKTDRSVLFQRLLPVGVTVPWVVMGWDSFRDLTFWKRLLEIA